MYHPEDEDAAYEAWLEAREESRRDEADHFADLAAERWDREEDARYEHEERMLEEHARFATVAGEDLERLEEVS